MRFLLYWRIVRCWSSRILMFFMRLFKSLWRFFSKSSGFPKNIIRPIYLLCITIYSQIIQKCSLFFPVPFRLIFLSLHPKLFLIPFFCWFFSSFSTLLPISNADWFSALLFTDFLRSWTLIIFLNLSISSDWRRFTFFKYYTSSL